MKIVIFEDNGKIKICEINEKIILSIRNIDYIELSNLLIYAENFYQQQLEKIQEIRRKIFCCD